MEVKLVFMKKDGTTQPFPLPSDVTFIGRRQDCDLCIPLSVVSRRHCQLYTEFDKLIIRDLKSRNGTHVNGESIEEVQLKAGDLLEVGPVKFVIQIDGVPETFDEFLSKPTEEAIRKTPAPPEAETQEADLEQILEGMEGLNSSQSQTMDIDADNIFAEDMLGDDDIDLDSEIV